MYSTYRDSNFETSSSVLCREVYYTASFVDRFIILCPYLCVSTIGGSTVFQLNRFSQTFNNVSRTLCPVSVEESTDAAPLFYIDIFTSSKTPLDYSVMIEPIDNFRLE